MNIGAVHLNIKFIDILIITIFTYKRFSNPEPMEILS